MYVLVTWMPHYHTASIISAVNLHLWLHTRWHTGLGCRTHTLLDRAMDAFSWWQKPDGQLTCMLGVDGDKIDEAVLREVRCMAKNTGMYENSLDEIFVPSCGYDTMIIDDSVQFTLVGCGLLKGFLAAGSGGS